MHRSLYLKSVHVHETSINFFRMCEDFHKDHISHDKKWIYSTDHMVACVACIVQTIEDPQISHLRKSPSIALLTKLVQIPTVLQDLKSDQDVTYHIIHVILGKKAK